MQHNVQQPTDVTFDFPKALQRLQEIRSKVTKYDEVSRDFLDEIQLIQEDFEYLSHHQRILAIICSGPKKNEWEQRLIDASDYLNNLETFPGMEGYKKSIEDELVKVANNIEPITSEIHNILTSKGRPLEPIDIFEALYINQQATPLHGNYKEVWEQAPTDIKQYCEQLADSLKASKIEKPKREKGMGQKAELLPPAQQVQTGKEAPIGQLGAQQFPTAELQTGKQAPIQGQLPAQEVPTGQQLPAQQLPTGQQLPAQQFLPAQQVPTGQQFPTQQLPAQEVPTGQQLPAQQFLPAQQLPTAQQFPTQQFPTQQLPTAPELQTGQQVLPAQEFPTGQQLPSETGLQTGKQAPIVAQFPTSQDVQTGKQAPTGEQPSPGQQIPTVVCVEREFVLEMGQAPQSGYH